MKVSLTASMLALTCLMSFARPAAGMGQRALVFEKPTEAGIWDHGDEFYLRLDLAEIADQKDQKFIWAGFHSIGNGAFSGELVLDQFGPQEKKFIANAKLLNASNKGRTFYIEVLNDKGEVIKEFFVKAGQVPGLPVPY